jgi:hypothetical protein
VSGRFRPRPARVKNVRHLSRMHLTDMAVVVRLGRSTPEACSSRIEALGRDAGRSGHAIGTKSSVRQKPVSEYDTLKSKRRPIATSEK